LEIFSKLSELGDTPSITYKKRCELFINNPPPVDWDGIYEMTEK
jgi:hypothetical protein